MAARTDSRTDLTRKAFSENMNRIIHEIQNNLQVIRMEAELGAVGCTSDKESDRIARAVEKIDILLAELRQFSTMHG